MPYRIASHSPPLESLNLTSRQKLVLRFLNSQYEEGEEGFFLPHVIARNIDLPPEATRAIAFSLYQKGFLERGQKPMESLAL